MRQLAALIIVGCWVSLQPPLSRAEAQAPTDPEVEAILEQLSSEARVGQLFLVTFFGTDIGPGSDIATLVHDYRVGGVVLLRDNNNLTAEPALSEQVLQISTSLQAAAAGTLPEAVAENGGDTATPTLGPTAAPRTDYVPLFIATVTDGSGWPEISAGSDLTPLPSNMAIGATWDPGNAEATGQIVGRELTAVGVNLLLGPSADVVELPQPTAQGDLGTRIFGGEPFWVSQMVAAYVRGAHLGSEGRLAVVPAHFPGYGGADRFAEVEIPTVRRTRDQLIQFDLRPFLAVTGGAAEPMSVANGVLVGHIRYQGFQADNLRAETKPISLDPAALQSLMSINQLATWHAAGGLVISDSLGVRGVRRHYDPTEQLFQGRRIALDAFVAGNDVLYLGSYGTDPEVNQTDAVIDTIEFFVQRYKDEPAFKEQVDNSVRRIIRQKLNLYGDFSLETVQTAAGGLAALETQDDVTADIARNALTLLSPDQAELLASPERGDNIVIFTDTTTGQRCSECPAVPLISVDALRSSILRFYGPDATGLMSFADIAPFELASLEQYLEFGPPEAGETGEGTPTPEPDALQFSLDSADWVVFVVRGGGRSRESVDVVSRFLAAPPIRPEARIIVMAMGAPYYLDSTEISKLSAYYGLYSYTQPFIDVAARALFQEFVPVGASPVSVSGINYEIIRATTADPDQVISLTYALNPAEEGPETGTSTPEPAVDVGDTLRLTTGVISDYNGNPVPDGTTVEFAFNYATEGIRETQTAETMMGVAQTTAPVTRSGELSITAASGEARISETVRLVTGGGLPSVLRPNLTPTLAPTSTETPVPLATTQPAPTTAPSNGERPEAVRRLVNFGDLFLSLLGLFVIAMVAFVIGLTQRDFNYGLLLGLPSLILGFIGYNYYALLLPGAESWRAMVGDGWGASLITWFAGVGGGLLGASMLSVWERWLVDILRRRDSRRQQS